MKKVSLTSSQQGATLIEALVAVLIFSIGILATVGLQAMAVSSTTDAKYRADASFLANQILGRIWGDPTNLTSFAETDTTVAELPSGKRTVVISGNRIDVMLTWQLPGNSNPHNFSVSTFVNVNN